MAHLIIGTAGHIDHGKSTLVKALTGTDPDRLPAEQERGMTIDLGYAHLQLPGGIEAGIVDVPGHERFIKNMLAGATGVDFALLVVAADDGVMLQTKEHMQILELLDIQRGLVAVTKKDMVDEETLELVDEEIKELLEGKKLEGSDICHLSSITGDGVEELRQKLADELKAFTKENKRAWFRLPVDRSFSKSGFGCVVTGTVTGGKAKLGDELELLPQQERVKVRGIQVHGNTAEEAEEGQRAALNLSGVKSGEVARGCQVVSPGRLQSSKFLAGELFLLDEVRQPLKNFTKVKLHLGTEEAVARAVFLDRNTRLGPGETAFVQFRLEDHVVADREDRFVIRMMSPQRTIGGGRILHIGDRKVSRFQTAFIHYLKSVGSGDPKTQVEAELIRARDLPPTLDELSKSLGYSETQVSDCLEAIGDDCLTVHEGRTERYVHRKVMEGLLDQIVKELEKFHAKQPILLGLTHNDIKRRIPETKDNPLLGLTVKEGIARGRLERTERCVHLADRRPQLSSNAEKIRKGMLDQTKAKPFETPRPRDLIDYYKPPQESEAVFDLLIQSNEIIKISNDVILHGDTFAHAKNVVAQRIEETGEITVADLRDMLGTSRKYSLPLLEHFDSIGFTQRIGDKRVLKKN
ncbi:MAG: selenocysteine-specific translation elongation factor [Planctomycetota bacterium]|jgi:selenocysteine-specific elongation factor|nr:selenocysteine-specific translation elongation factor [Planctomycetota bacterium]MDP7254423.1 selenocysteine-specific translation elongation factor [Planctomycetota bacterium]